MFQKNIVMIGASAGGPRILRQVFTGLPRLNAAILIVQHMPDYINQSLVDVLARATSMDVGLAQRGETIAPGAVYLAPSEKHMVLVGNQKIDFTDGEKVGFVKPSIDVAMCSLKPLNHCQFLGILLTGMGRDGANGLLHIRNIGGQTIAQDEATSVIYGMPKEAVALGAAEFQLDPESIHEKMIAWAGILPE